ncbi:MAG: ABC transporter substrate-binding protein [Bacillota bacterium]
MKKSSKLVLLIVCLALVLAVGCSTKTPETSSSGGAPAEPVELVISTWGFNEDLLWENVFKPFEEKHNVKIVLEVGNNADRLNKVRVRDNVQVDIIFLADYFAMQGIEEGLFEKIDVNNIPNINKLYDIAKAPLGADYGPAYTIGSFGIVYDAAAVSGEVTSWGDLWKPEFKDRISIPDITTTSGPMIIDLASKLGGSDKIDEDVAFSKLKELSPNILKYYSRSSDLVNMLAQGEVVIAAGQEFSFESIKKAVPTAKWVVPKEGAYAVVNTINIVKGTKNKALAEEFINWVLSDEVQRANAVAKVDAPANKNVKLTPEEASGLTYGEETIAKLQLLDWSNIIPQMKGWIDRWNREIVAQ